MEQGFASTPNHPNVSLQLNEPSTIRSIMAYCSLVTPDFYDTPWIGKLPRTTDVLETYDIETLLRESGVADPSKVSEILVYAFFTGVGQEDNIPTVRAVYELYTESPTDRARYSQLMNAVFNQPDTVMNSANLWMPYTSNGTLYARIPDKWITPRKPGQPPFVIPQSKKVYKNLGAAMEAYAKGEDTIFDDIFLLGYRLKE